MQPTAAPATSSGPPAKSVSPLSSGNLKQELAAAVSASPTQVITVVTPSPQNHSTVLSNPVVVQVSSSGQLIVAVSPDSISNTTTTTSSISNNNHTGHSERNNVINNNSNNNSQTTDAITSVDTPGTTSNEDEDGPSTGFDDFAAAAAATYTNGSSNPNAMTYFSSENAYPTNYYNYNSQTVNQIIADGGAYLVMESDPGSAASSSQRASPHTEDFKQMIDQQRVSIQPQTQQQKPSAGHENQSHAEPIAVTVANLSAASSVPATTLLINPFTIHASPASDQTVVQSIAVSNPVVTLTAASAGASGQHHHQNVRDMDIVHVQWLIENYETAEGVSLPRSTLYTHYQNHCQQHSIDPVNAASFGKLIRSVFIGLRTRRLGTRGNSKYHYYGIRVKPGSGLSRIVDSASAPTTPEPAPSPPKKIKSSAVAAKSHPVTENQQPVLPVTSADILLSHLGDPKSILPSVWPDEPTIPNNTDTDSPSVLATKFAACYRKHYEEIINALGNLNFSLVEQIWSKFWQPEVREKSDSQKQNRLFLSVSQLHQLTSTTTTVTEESSQITSLADWIIQTDYTLYNALITSLLLPNLLKPIPQQLTQQIRNFAKNISQWMTNALNGYDETFVLLKLGAVGAFSHTLRRYTSLNHLSSAARAVLQNQQQISQMISDLSRVDFRNVQEQASWVCNCDDDVVEQIEQSFKSLLQQDNPFDRWGSWCDQVLDSCLGDATVSSATQFFFKWGFYSSLVMRDLTLRSASSFGSFHLIRLLFDEYIFYLIEHRVAKATSKTPLQVLGEARAPRAHGPVADVSNS